MRKLRLKKPLGIITLWLKLKKMNRMNGSATLKCERHIPPLQSVAQSLGVQYGVGGHFCMASHFLNNHMKTFLIINS